MSTSKTKPSERISAAERAKLEKQEQNEFFLRVALYFVRYDLQLSAIMARMGGLEL